MEGYDTPLWSMELVSRDEWRHMRQTYCAAHPGPVRVSVALSSFTGLIVGTVTKSLECYLLPIVIKTDNCLVKNHKVALK